MRFVCERNILLKEISMAQEIISSKNVISILSNIYLEAKDDELIIKATDLKVNFETKVPVTVLESGPATVFGDKFLGILGAAPEGDIEFEYDDNKVRIKTSVKKANFQLKSIASDKFPDFPVSDVDYFEIPIKDFKEMVQQTVFAVSDDETRFFMNGVFLEKSDDSITMVATDGRRMAHINKKIDGIKDFSPVIVPPKILNLMVKRSGNEGMIALAITPKNVFLRFGTYSLSSVVIDGTFPNYRKVIPEEQTNSFIINRKEILEALRRVSILVEQKSHRIYFNLKSGLLSVFSEESEMGDAKEEIPCKYEGEEVSLALNYSYMEEPFKVIAGEEILIRFTNSSKAITITSVPEADFFHIVMPMQP